MKTISLGLTTSNTETLKEIIRTILDDGNLESARHDFRTRLTTMNHGELVAAVQQLEEELGGGAILIAETRLKDFLLAELVSSNVLKKVGNYPPGHPLQNYLDENRMSEQLCHEFEGFNITEDSLPALTNLFNHLAEIEIHYVRKENQLFPFLEAAGFTHPSTAMWQFHDDVRKLIKNIRAALEAKDVSTLKALFPKLVKEIREMALREELVLLPAAARLIANEDWGKIRIGEEEIGYMPGLQPVSWQPAISGYLQHSGERMEAMVAISRDFIENKISSDEARHLVREKLETITGGEFAFVEVELERQGVAQHDLKEKIEELVDIYKEALGTGDIKQCAAGHPVHSFFKENRAIRKLIAKIRNISEKNPPDEDKLHAAYEQLMLVNVHFARKEYQLFPYLEKKNFNTPSTIMWTLHDDIRANLKYHKTLADERNFADLLTTQESLLSSIEEMLFKEEKILFPVSLELLDQDDWIAIRQGEEEIGYCFIPEPLPWPDPKDAVYTHPSKLEVDTPEPTLVEGLIDLDEGQLTQEQIKLIFSFLPVDVTYTDENNIVRFYNKGDYRIFPRSPGIIGREVRYCHPPKSVDMVLQIIDTFRAGEKDVAEFWIQISEQFIHIRFFALRDKDKNYRGVLEIMQEVSGIRKLEGNKRLLDWE